MTKRVRDQSVGKRFAFRLMAEAERTEPLPLPPPLHEVFFFHGVHVTLATLKLGVLGVTCASYNVSEGCASMDAAYRVSKSVVNKVYFKCLFEPRVRGVL